MFTIKHVYDFSEDLYHSVMSVHADTNMASDYYGVSFTTPFGASELHHLIGNDGEIGGPAKPKGERGTVFVMNDSGKTRARYGL